MKRITFAKGDSSHFYSKFRQFFPKRRRRRKTDDELRLDEIDHLLVERVQSSRSIQSHFSKRMNCFKYHYRLLKLGQRTLLMTGNDLRTSASGLTGDLARELEEVEKCWESIAARCAGLLLLMSDRFVILIEREQLSITWSGRNP